MQKLKRDAPDFYKDVQMVDKELSVFLDEKDESICV